MTAQKYSLPNRKWYTLPQAIKQIYKLTGEQLEIEDLIHFWTIEKLNISTFVSATQTFSSHILEKAKKCFYELNSVRVGNLIFNKNIQRDEWEVALFATNTPEVDKLIFFDEDGYLIAIFYEITEDGVYLEISGLLSIIPFFQDFTFPSRDRGILFNNSMVFCIHPNKKEKSLEKFTFILVVNDSVFSDDKFISYENLYITDKDLDEFLTGRKSKFKIQHIARLPNGRPKNNLKQIILEIAKETFKANPNQSRNKIATAILEHLEKHYFQEYPVINLRTIDNYLKEAEIGNPKARNKAKPIIKDPFK